MRPLYSVGNKRVAVLHVKGFLVININDKKTSQPLIRSQLKKLYKHFFIDSGTSKCFIYTLHQNFGNAVLP